MIEAVRSLGFAARFVTGYLYDPALDGGPAGTQGAGATHAWVQVYLPGAGWVEFDPTNGIVGGRNLIRVGVARDPKQAVPLAGTFIGGAGRLSGHGGRGAGHPDPGRADPPGSARVSLAPSPRWPADPGVACGLGRLRLKLPALLGSVRAPVHRRRHRSRS